MTSFPALAIVVAGATAIALLGACSPTTQQPLHPSTTAAAASGRPSEYNPPGDIPDDQTFVTYTAADGTYSVKYPEGWARTDSGDSVVFTDKFNSETLTPHNGFYQPTEDFARTVEQSQIAATTDGFTAGSVSTVQRSAGPAILITYQRQSAPSPVTGKSVTQDVARYEFAKGGRGVAITLASPAGSDNVDPWRVVTDSFTWLT